MKAWDALVSGRLQNDFQGFHALCREVYRAEARRFLPAIAASLALGILAALPPILIAYLIDEAVAGDSGGHAGLIILAVLAAFVMLALADAGLTWLRQHWTIDAQVRLRARMATKLFSTELQQPLRRLQEDSRAAMIRSFDDLDETLDFMAGTIPEFITNAILAVSYAALLLLVEPRLAAVTLVATALAFATAVMLAQQSRSAFAVWLLDRDRCFTLIVEAFTSLLTIKSMSAHRTIENLFRSKLEADNVSLAAMRRRTARAEAASRGWLTFVPGIVIAAGIWMVGRGDLSIGELVLFLTVSASLSAPVGSICAHWEAAQRTFAAIERISHLRATELEDLDAEGRRDWGVGSGLALAGVGHRYAGGSNPALQDVTLALPPGSHIAITGRSGGGKTTFAHIVARLLEPSSGVLRAGGIKAAEIGLTPYRRRVLMLPHETEIFSASLADNITLWDPSFSAADLAKAVKEAALTDVVDQLPQGYTTLLSSDGGPLSAGQRQRVGIARALIRRPDILILDEATSALDANTEIEVMANIRSAMQGKTLIVITHREELAARFDQRIVVDGGRADHLPLPQAMVH